MVVMDDDCDILGLAKDEDCDCGDVDSDRDDDFRRGWPWRSSWTMVVGWACNNGGGGVGGSGLEFRKLIIWAGKKGKNSIKKRGNFVILIIRVVFLLENSVLFFILSC